MKPITSEMKSVIGRALATEEEVLVSANKIDIRKADIATLCEPNWLNDSIIDFYMEVREGLFFYSARYIYQSDFRQKN